VQHAHQMCQAAGDLGRIYAVHGSYLQDWLLLENDWNWRLVPELSGESRAVADVGSHWCDLVQFVTGLKIVRVMADLVTIHPMRKRPKVEVETYAGKVLRPEDLEEVPINTEDYGSILLEFDTGAHGSLTVNQCAAGRKNRLYFEIDGSKCAIAWNQERENELWVGRRDGPNQTIMKDPSLLYPANMPITRAAITKATPTGPKTSSAMCMASSQASARAAISPPSSMATTRSRSATRCSKARAKSGGSM
jgi:predicted dehydrogenase